MRNLGIPTVFDRIIQQSMVQVLSPIFEERFSEQVMDLDKEDVVRTQ